MAEGPFNQPPVRSEFQDWHQVCSPCQSSSTVKLGKTRCAVIPVAGVSPTSPFLTEEPAFLVHYKLTCKQLQPLTQTSLFITSNKGRLPALGRRGAKRPEQRIFQVAIRSFSLSLSRSLYPSFSSLLSLSQHKRVSPSRISRRSHPLSPTRFVYQGHELHWHDPSSTGSCIARHRPPGPYAINPPSASSSPSAFIVYMCH